MLVKRFIAFFIDLIIVLFPFWLLGVLFGTKDPETGGYQLKGLSIFYIWIAHLLYFAIQEFFWKATIGKRLLKLKVVKLDGSELTKEDVAKRHVLCFFEIYMLLIIPCLMVLIDKRHQRLGDKLAKTIVIENV